MMSEHEECKLCLNGEKHVMRAFISPMRDCPVFRCQNCLVNYPEPLVGGFYKRSLWFEELYSYIIVEIHKQA